MFKRFVVGHINKQSGVNQGILGVAYRLSREEKLKGSNKIDLDNHLAWLMDSFTIPDIFDKPESLKGVCWFKDTAVDIIDHVIAIVPHVEACGFVVTELSSNLPGLIIYEDDSQIVAIPNDESV
ncbi:MAG: hypothetical protein JKY55_14420 [Aliivibrio sp.]|uniref:hypothetical protein n=1 Tax=Aliivibrio sp. TaxID=1872443 RepID=UPI001A5611FD|nr:hypothetical protein [Aliivibrio sp.]